MARQKRIIKVTEQQLRETEGKAFYYLDDTDPTKPFNGQSTITAQGKLNGEEDAEPLFTDRVSKQLTPQSWSRYRMYGNINRPAAAEPKVRDYNTFNEGVAIAKGADVRTAQQGDENQDGIDDMYTNIADMGYSIDTLSDSDKLNDLGVLPLGISEKAQGLVNAMKEANLNPKQIAMVVNKLEDEFPELSQNGGFVKSLLRQQIDPNDDRDFD